MIPIITIFRNFVKNQKQHIPIFLYITGSIFFTFPLYIDSILGKPFVMGTKQTLVFLSGILIITLGFIIEKWSKINHGGKTFISFISKRKAFHLRTISDNINTKFTKLSLVITTSFIILLIFFMFYFVNSLTLADASIFDYYDLLFELDPPRAIDDMVVVEANHYRTKVHPLYVLMVNPIGSMINNFLGQRMLSAILVNSFFGALAVQLGFIFLWLFTKNIFKALLITGLFGVSASQSFISVIPDTSSLAICSLILTYTLFYFSLKSKKIHFYLWILTGVFSLGVTTTNFMQTMICFSILMLSFGVNQQNLLKVIRYFFTVLFFAIIFSLIQNSIYPSTGLFFLPEAYQEEFLYTNTILLSQPIRVTTQVFKSFFLDNIIAPIPNVFIAMRNSLPHLTFTSSRNYLPFGQMALIIWVMIIILAFINLLKRMKEKNFFIIGILCCLMFNLLLHHFYGLSLLQPDHFELFLYTGNLTFLVIIIVTEYFKSKSNYYSIALVILVLFVGANNISVLTKIGNYYQPILTSSAQSYGDKLNDPNLKELINNPIKYQDELHTLRQTYGVHNLPDVKFYLFGMAEREKFIYKEGKLIDAITGEETRSWEITEERIFPSDYLVELITPEGEPTLIYEDEIGVWIKDGKQNSLLSKGYVNLPVFEGKPYANTLKVLHQ